MRAECRATDPAPPCHHTDLNCLCGQMTSPIRPGSSATALVSGNVSHDTMRSCPPSKYVRKPLRNGIYLRLRCLAAQAEANGAHADLGWNAHRFQDGESSIRPTWQAEPVDPATPL